ncbi:hypothetical protein [Natrinema sp. SYSU A 869]|uniref:hypothetical protein n=1 Tax=Natrinema sp. SYSU A 869 TaxID=2871694 RepID=UPI00210489AF|nr:hypothetical protein [Natrinema sp. SYSU A 869]
MKTAEHWVLDGEDERLAADFELGVGAQPARVLAYLVRRVEDDRVEDPRARQIDIRLGTELGNQAVADALSRLSDRGLVTETTLESEEGRPPKAWSTDYTVETAMHDAYATRAAELIGTANADPSGSTPADRGTIRLGFNWRPNGLHVPFYAAQIEGRTTSSVSTLSSSTITARNRRFEPSLAATSTSESSVLPSSPMPDEMATRSPRSQCSTSGR